MTYSTKELMADLNYPMGSGAWTDEVDNGYLDLKAAVVQQLFPTYRDMVVQLADAAVYADELHHSKRPEWLAWLLALSPSNHLDAVRNAELHTEDQGLQDLLRAARLYTALFNELWGNE